MSIFIAIMSKAFYPTTKNFLKKFNKQAIAKRHGWKSFCNSIENKSRTTRFAKVLSKNKIPPTLLEEKSSGNWTNSSSKTIHMFMLKHLTQLSGKKINCARISIRYLV